MTTEIDEGLEKLLSLWVDGSNESLRQVPALCREIVRAAAVIGADSFNPSRLQRAGLLAGKAEHRLRTCIEIQTRTGAYSRRGALELAPRVITARWEA